MNRTPQFGDIYQYNNNNNCIILGIMLHSTREWLYDAGNDVDDNEAAIGFDEYPEEIGYTFICNQDDVTIVPREWRVGDIVIGVWPKLIVDIIDDRIISVFIDTDCSYIRHSWVRTEFNRAFTFIENQDDIELPTKRTCCKEKRYKSGELPVVGDIIESKWFTHLVTNVNPFTRMCVNLSGEFESSANPPSIYSYVQRYDENVPHYPQIGDIYQNLVGDNSDTYRLVVAVDKNRTKTLVLTDNDVYMAPWNWFTSDLVAEKNNRFICNQEELEPVFDESLIIPGAIVEWYSMIGNPQPHSFYVVEKVTDKSNIYMWHLEMNIKGLVFMSDYKSGQVKYVQHMNDNLCPNEWCQNCHGKEF